MNRSVFFHQALEIAVEKIKNQLPALKNEVVLIRNILGQIRVLLSGSEKDYDKSVLSAINTEMRDELGVYASPGQFIYMFTSEAKAVEDYFKHEDRYCIFNENIGRIWILERQIIGQDWTRKPIERKTKNRRVTFYGVKGGVGRSTALVLWAWHLAKNGKKVLIVDLDLESPGISRTLLPASDDLLPDFGIVDWFIEDALDQKQGDEILENMTAQSPISQGVSGEIRVSPCFGRKTGAYMPKLSRCYMDSSGTGIKPWGDRLNRLVESLETKIQPDVVLLDSRAGLHDIAALTITRMDADVFLFAVDAPQTWSAYAYLFQQWKNYSHLGKVREKIQIIAGMVPETNREVHLKHFIQQSWELFSTHLYDEISPGQVGLFNFDPEDTEAPHYPLPIFWHRGLQEFDPCNSTSGLDEQLLSASMGIFIKEAETMIFPEENRI